MSSDEASNGAGPLSWRDVYRAVNEAEGRILAAIKEAILPLSEASDDHEVRLRAVEAGASPFAVRITQKLESLGGQQEAAMNTSREAVALVKVTKEASDSRQRIMLGITGFLTIVNLALGAIVAFIALIPHL